MKKYKIHFIVGLAILVGLYLFSLTMKQIDFTFANEGHIMCANHRDWGILSSGEMTCYGLVKIVDSHELPTPTPYQPKDDGEVILKK